MMNYLACDAGGTKADFILFNSSGEVLAKCRTTGANANFISQESALNAVEKGICECMEKAEFCLEQIKLIALFIPGFIPCLPMLKKRLQYDNIELQGDANIAFYGALGNGQGIVVLSGTGSFARGRDSYGKEATSGGWGPLFGDYGSGYHIGRMCLSELAIQYDMGQSESMLASEVKTILEITSIGELRAVSYRADFTREKLADLSFAVAKAARQGDKTADRILDNAAKELVKLATIVAGRIEADGLRISLIGGVTNMGAIITDKFRYYLAKELPECSYHQCKYTPIIGAALYILEREEHLDITNTQVINHLTGGI